VKLATLFVNKAKQLTIARGLGSQGIDVVPAQSVGGLLQLLRRSDVQAVLLEDADTELIDWLAMLEMRMAGAVPVIVVGSSAGLGMAEALLHGMLPGQQFEGPLAGTNRREQRTAGVQAGGASPLHSPPWTPLWSPGCRPSW
jgi:hypothetical protein